MEEENKKIGGKMSERENWKMSGKMSERENWKMSGKIDGKEKGKMIGKISGKISGEENKSKSWIYLVDMFVIIGSLFFVVFAIGFVQPLVIFPVDNLETTDSYVLFSIDKAESILIDKDIEFTNPEVFSARDNLKINLEPGEYYWKAVSSLGVETEIRKLTIVSRIDLRLKEINEGYEIVNAGNTRLNVDVYEDENKIDSFKLDVYEQKKVAGNKLIGGWDED
jgi:hypothetical protein